MSEQLKTFLENISKDFGLRHELALKYPDNLIAFIAPDFFAKEEGYLIELGTEGEEERLYKVLNDLYKKLRDKGIYTFSYGIEEGQNIFETKYGAFQGGAGMI